jgi:hypothetical protein
MKRLILFCVTLIITINVTAYDFAVDGIYYNITSSSSPYAVAVTYKTTSYNSYSGSVNIPATVSYNNIVYSVDSIGNYAFYGCTLSSITIPNSINKLLGGDIFSHSTISKLYYNHNVAHYLDGDEESFEKTHTFKTATIDTLEIGKDVNSLPTCFSYALKKATNLKNVVVESSNQNFCAINGLLFTKDQKKIIYCPSSKNGKYIIPEGVISIGDYSFGECSQLTAIVIPSSVDTIEQEAFNYAGLTSLTIPQNVIYIEKFAFGNCSSLVNLTYNVKKNNYIDNEKNNNVDNYTNMFTNCTALTTIIIGSNVENIQSGTFLNCTGLLSVKILSPSIIIGKYAFSGCTALTSFKVAGTPDNTLAYITTSSKNGTTYSASSLGTFYNTANSTFSSTTGLCSNINSCTLYVPIGTKADYAIASPWNLFTNIVEYTPVAAINEEHVNTIKIKISNGNLNISNLPNTNEPISIFTVNGIQLYSGISRSESLSIALPVHGVYIVRVGGNGTKVIY